MARVRLPEDATVLYVVRTLDNPRVYVEGLFNKMHDYKRLHGSAFVRIGITGGGRIPHYRLEPTNSTTGFLAEFGNGIGDLARHFEAYHGQTHKQLDWGMSRLKGENWSRVYMSYEQIRELLLKTPKPTKRPATAR
ncbi:hypothetical protein DPM33_23560 [Mesorhizobium hawassense]|uniref:Uncharacterized protein n=1 Tax=Mesorhizobium hawassense TaxID=1209954 RepID=A0A330HJB1_9HYPH|nr:hypothetical protein [Mesorhizobium hawassense]RAZ88505.1 hypothetical protein DPM33_23560 [Mesorhizobium hawassense]